MTHPLMSLQDVHKSFGSARAVSGVTLDIQENEFFALLGPSGSGKSTLLRIISGLERAESGSVYWDGRDISSMPSHRRNFGLIFQDYALFPHLNVFENVAFGLKVRKLKREEIRQRVAAALAQVDLQNFTSRSVTDLSGGEQQRVALARALAPRPRLLLFDEPLGALDRRLREYLLAELRAILRSSGVPAIYVTHDQDEAFTLGDQIMLLHEGEIVQHGRPADVAAHPVSQWAAEFLGAGNVVIGKMLSDGRVETALGTLTVPCARKQAEGTSVTLLIRPQDVTRGDVSSGWRGRVRDVIFQQNAYRIVLENGFYFYLNEPPAVGEKVFVNIRGTEIQCLRQ
ncbi:MAG: ABC transporter ATP-binding protein [Anaerolineales bacterium]|nr:ABC transporter ATP-binding protein [Anaerolineales bacterium]